MVKAFRDKLIPLLQTQLRKLPAIALTADGFVDAAVRHIQHEGVHHKLAEWTTVVHNINKRFLTRAVVTGEILHR